MPYFYYDSSNYKRIPLKKRYPRPKMESGKLDVWFGRTEPMETPDMCVQSGENAGGSPTRSFVINFFTGGHAASERPGYENTFLGELESRGFDLSTLKFSIRKKKA